MEDEETVACAVCGGRLGESEVVETTSGPICRSCYADLEGEREQQVGGATAVVAVRAIGYGGLAAGLIAGGLSWNPLFVLGGVFAVVSAEMAVGALS